MTTLLIISIIVSIIVALYLTIGFGHAAVIVKIQGGNPFCREFLTCMIAWPMFWYFKFFDN